MTPCVGVDSSARPREVTLIFGRVSAQLPFSVILLTHSNPANECRSATWYGPPIAVLGFFLSFVFASPIHVTPRGQILRRSRTHTNPTHYLNFDAFHASVGCSALQRSSLRRRSTFDLLFSMPLLQRLHVQSGAGSGKKRVTPALFKLF